MGVAMVMAMVVVVDEDMVEGAMVINHNNFPTGT